MDNYDFSDELSDTAVSDTTGKATHVLLKNDCCTYRFEDRLAQSSFYAGYLKNRAQRLKSQDDTPSYVGEIPSGLAPIIFSFRSLYYMTDESDDIESDLLLDIARILQSVTRRMGNVANALCFENAQLTCAVLSRFREEEGKDAVDIIFHFPNAIEDIGDIEANVFPTAVSELQKKQFNKELNFAKSLHQGVYREAIPLYGSAGHQEDVAYTYLNAIAVSSHNPFLTGPPEDIFPLVQTGLCRAKILADSLIEDLQTIVDEDERMEEFWLPVILSVHGYEEKTSRSKLNATPGLRFNILGFERATKDYENAVSAQDTILKSIQEFVKLWNPWRLDQLSEWLLIGEALFNLYEGGGKGIGLWREITQGLVERRRQTLAEVGLDEDGNLADRTLLNVYSRSAESEDSTFSANSDEEGSKNKYRPRLRAPRNVEDILKDEQSILNRLYDHDNFKVPRLINITERSKEFKQKKTAVPYYLQGSELAVYRKYYYAFLYGRNTVRAIGDNAREDSPIEYAKMHQAWCKSALEDSTSELDTDIARALFRYLWLDWFCETVSDNRVDYYYMYNNRLVHDRGQQKLKKLIVEEFVSLFYRMRNNVTLERDASNGDKKAKGDALLVKIDKVIAKLKSAAFKKRLVTEASIFFNTAGATSFFNENVELTCVNTGVLVATTTGILFRKGRLEDFITKRTAAYYLDDIDMNNPGVKRIMDWANETFLRKADMVDWWWRFHASLLRGGNDDKIFPFIHGEKGNEGKSAWTRFFANIFGDYASHVEMSYFTSSPKDANTATPVTAGLKGVRAVWAEESEDTKPIQAGPFKKKTGKDKIPYRQLFGEQGVMLLQATFIGVGNDIPPFTSAALPVKERLAIVRISSQRDADAPDDIEEQYKKKRFKRDNFFDLELEYYGALGLWLLVQYYGKYLVHKLHPYPASVVKYTERYWEEKDKYYRFTKDMITHTKDNNDTLAIDELYEIFKEWHERMYPKKPIPINDELRKELRNRWGKMNKGRFIGVKLNTPERKQRRNVVGKKNYEEEIEQYEG